MTTPFTPGPNPMDAVTIQSFPDLLAPLEAHIQAHWEEFYPFFDLHDRLLKSRDYQVSFTSDGVLVSWHDWEAGGRDHRVVPWPAFLAFYRQHS